MPTWPHQAEPGVTELRGTPFGRSYESLAQTAIPADVGGAAGLVMSLADLIVDKEEVIRRNDPLRAAKRDQDIADLEYLRGLAD
jgi:hypothetical protein